MACVLLFRLLLHVALDLEGVIFLAGSMGGVMEAFCLSPIDVIKTRIQLERTKTPSNILHLGRKIAANEGVGALWKGVFPFATHLTLKYALRMGSNSFYQNLMRDEKGHLDGYRRLAAGAMAGVTEAVVIVTPFEVVKIRLQQQQGLDKALLRYKVQV
jgi:solute carrier family 25 (mitochondrial citrate transporter), member 1